MLGLSNDLVLERSVNLWMLHERRCRYFNDDVVDADLQFRIQLVDPFAHLSRAIHFNFGGQKEMRYRPERGHQSLGNRTAHLAGWFVAISCSLCRRRFL